MKLREAAESHIRETRVRAHALAVLKNDLMNIRLVSSAMRGGLLAQSTNPYSSPFPGYLRFTATTGRDTTTSQYGDTQEIEYYIDTDSQSSNSQAGVLVRTLDRVLLADNPQITNEERLLTNIQSMEMEFYDGTTWQTSWDTSQSDGSSSSSSASSASSSSSTSTDVPQGIRIRLIPFAEPGQPTPAPLEVTVPWNTQKP
jgi:hypothetical protein